MTCSKIVPLLYQQQHSVRVILQNQQKEEK